jgi:tetratricopeptide (TPR) repeat protein
MLLLSRSLKSRFILLCFFLLVSAAALGPRITASALTNKGYLVFSAALLEENEIASLANSAAVKSSQRYWEKSLELVSANPSAWRGLGWTYVTAGQYSSAVDAWQHGGFGAVDLISLGEVARSNNDYETALLWYQQAMDVAPELTDPWYYIGLAYVDMEKWKLALEAFQRGTEKINHKTIGPSSVYYRIGWLAQRHLDPPDINQAQSAYEMALAIDDFSSSEERTQVHFSLGEVLHQVGREAEALQEYEWVVKHQPDHYWAHIQLGVLYWQFERDLAQAERVLFRAMRLNPQKKWAYRWMGAVYQQSGRRELAIEMYFRVLEIDPRDEQIQIQLYQMMDGS